MNIIKTLPIFLALFSLTIQVLNRPSKDIGISVASFINDFIFDTEIRNDVPYSYSMDSAQFISFAFRHEGIYLPSTIENLSNLGIDVTGKDLQIGDLIFFSNQGYSIENVGVLILHNTIAYIPKPGELPIEEELTPEFWSGLFISARRIYKSEKIEYVLEKMYQKEIKQSFFKTYIVTMEKGIDPGYLRFYTDDVSETQLLMSEDEDGSRTYGKETHNPNIPELEVKSGIIGREVTQKRPLNKKKVEFVCIHDTGDINVNASKWNTVVTTYNTTTSWHFTVDHLEIYQHVPLDEWARHAGDGLGENPFKLVDTGVPFTTDKPDISFNEEDNHLYINGIKSELMAGKLDGKYYHGITDSGLYTEKGENGNYYIDQYYVNSVYKVNSNSGGNTNSIGIESCVYYGVKYGKVMRRLANLVAHLLRLYNLGTNRVLQHRHFSGKLCPQSMIRADEETPFGYNHFTALVEINDFIVKQMPGSKFTYKSLTPDLLSDDGYLLKYVTEDTEVSYEVTVEFEGEVVTKKYTTLIHPKEDPDPEPEKEKMVYALTEINRRKGPSSESEIVGLYQEGAHVSVVDRVNTDWYKDVDGYYLTAKEEYVQDLYGTVVKVQIYVYDEPSSDSTMISLANQGDEIMLLRKEGDWYYVKLKTTVKGYIHKDTISVA